MKKLLVLLILTACASSPCNIMTGECEGTDNYVIEAEEGEHVKLVIDASDKDGDDLKYIFSEPFNESGEWIAEIGNYSSVVKITDGRETVEEKIKVVVKERTFDIETSEEINEGEKVIIKVKTDLIVAIADSRFKQENKTFIWQTERGDAGDYTFMVEVSDGKRISSKEVNVKVNEINSAPIIRNITQS